MSRHILTRAIIVNSPNNPSGVIYPPELIEKIVDLCEHKGIFMICDDIYHKLTFDGNKAVLAAGLASEYDYVLTLRIEIPCSLLQGVSALHKPPDDTVRGLFSSAAEVRAR